MSYIRITRYPYEEPFYLDLVIEASNDNVQGKLEIYVGPNDLIEWANALEPFPIQIPDTFKWELGSEAPEDRWVYYFGFRLVTFDLTGHCAIHLRFNNNRPPPDREVAEFYIEAEPNQINRLGSLCREFAKMKHSVLYWTLENGYLIH